MDTIYLLIELNRNGQIGEKVSLIVRTLEKARDESESHARRFHLVEARVYHDLGLLRITYNDSRGFPLLRLEEREVA